MAAPTYPVPTSNPNMMMVVTFFLMWVTNIVVIYVANMFLPGQFVLGTVNIPAFSGLLLSSAVLAGIVTLAMPFFTEMEIKRKAILTPLHWMIGYFMINVISIWLIARAAEILGLGIASWMFVVGVAVVLDFVQGMVMMTVPAMFMKKKDK